VLYIFGLPLVWKFGNAGLAVSSFGVLLFILWKPAGVIQLVDPIRIRLIAWLARRRGVDPSPFLDPSVDTMTAATAGGLAVRERPALRVPDQRRQPTTGTRLLEARGLRKRFGGVVAVDNVSFQVYAGETLGLIGPNGAGKTTTFELLGGFTRADAGRVLFNRRDISRLGPEDRAHLGLIRSFQDAALFPTMTVKETVMLALERTHPTRFLSSLAGWTLPERAKERRARELVATMGLDGYRDKQIQELSTGTRRITEIACLVALEPTLLLLDEPSSGIAQRESEALGTLLLDLRRQLGITLVVIEHDIPLIMGISDRIVAMADGRVISEGTPDVVRADPLVIDAYLGGSVAAIERSGTTAAPAALNGHGATTLLESVRGLGDVRRKELLDRFPSTDALAAASLSDLQGVPGVGPGLARRIREAFDADAPAIR
jgi:ABC-type branched-subunit amino acid transport system ATPase component